MNLEMVIHRIYQWLFILQRKINLPVVTPVVLNGRVCIPVLAHFAQNVFTILVQCAKTNN